MSIDMEETNALDEIDSPPETRRAADALVDVLIEAGVEVVFGIPGGTIAPIYDALLDRPAIRVITTRHENMAMFAAAGYTRATGKLGVVLVTSGPGVINAMTGLASAHCDGLPVLLLAGEVPRRNQGKGALQDGGAHFLNIAAMARHICKLSLEVVDGAMMPTMVRRAIATALSGRRGPVVLTLPLDVSSANVVTTDVSIDVASRFVIAPAALEKVATRLRFSERRLIFAGSGVRMGDGAAQLLAFAERIQCPVMTTPKGKGVFPENHPLSLGVYGLGGHPSSSRYLEEGVDTLLAIGTSLGDLSTNGWSHQLQPRRSLIHVDIDAQQIGRSYTTEIAIVAPADQFLRELSAHVPIADAPRVFGLTRHDAAAFAAARTGLIAPQRALWELQQALPADTIFTCDSGEHFLFAVHYLESRLADGFIAMSGLGSMGSGIGGAVGAKLARPQRTVAAVCGDGGFAMCGTEVATAVVERLPIVFAVMNDQRLGMVELGHNALYGRAPEFGTGPLNITEMASALGAESIVIDTPGQILELAGHLQRLRGPIVLDVRIDPEVKMQKNGRFDALKKTAQNRPRYVN